MNGLPLNEGTLYFLKYPLLLLMYVFLVFVIRAMVRQLPTHEELSATSGTRGLPSVELPPAPVPPPRAPTPGPPPAETRPAPTLPYTGPREWLEVLSGMPAPAGGIPVRGPLIFGRSNDADVRVPDPFVSSRHARLTPDPDGAILEDLGSRNGTSLGAVRLEGPVRLKDGDVFAVGDATFRYRSSVEGA